MRKIKHFEIFNETYQVNLVVVVGGDKNDVVALMKKKYKCDIYKYYSKDFNLGAGAHFDFQGNYPYKMIWILKLTMNPQEIGALVHEISHHVSNLCDERNIKKDSEVDEPVAYLIEYYVREILKKVKGI